MKRALFLALALICTDAAALGPEKVCFRVAGEAQDTCSVSLGTLIARGEEFDGKIVIVEGVFAYFEQAMLFSSREALLSSDSSDGVLIRMPADPALLKRLLGFDHQPVYVKGKYSALAADVSGYGGFRTGGVISGIVGVSSAELKPWGYFGPDPYGTSRVW